MKIVLEVFLQVVFKHFESSMTSKMKSSKKPTTHTAMCSKLLQQLCAVITVLRQFLQLEISPIPMPRTAQLLEKLGVLEDEANRAWPDLYKEIFQQNPGTYPRPGKPPGEMKDILSYLVLISGYFGVCSRGRLWTFP